MRKPTIWVFRPGLTQTGLYNLRSKLEPSNFGFKKKRYCTFYGAKTKALFSHMQFGGFLIQRLKYMCCPNDNFIIDLSDDLG